MLEFQDVKPFRFDLLPLPKPIQPVAVGELVPSFTKEQLAGFRAEAKALEPERLTKVWRINFLRTGVR